MASIIQAGDLITVDDYPLGVTLADIAGAAGVTLLTQSGAGLFYLSGRLLFTDAIFQMTDESLYHQITTASFGIKPVQIDVNSGWEMTRCSYITNIECTTSTIIEYIGDGNNSGYIDWQDSFLQNINVSGDQWFLRAYNSADVTITNNVSRCTIVGGFRGRIGGTNSTYNENIHLNVKPIEIFQGVLEYNENVIQDAEAAFQWGIANSRDVTVKDLTAKGLTISTVALSANSAGAGIYTADFVDFNTSPFVRTIDNQSDDNLGAFGTVNWKYSYKPSVFEGTTPLENMRLAIYDSSDTEIANKLSDVNGDFTNTEVTHSSVVVTDAPLNTVTDNGPFVTVLANYDYVTLLQSWDGGSTNIFTAFLTADPFVVATEAVAAAYTGISVVVGTSTITVSGTRTIQELYDYLKDWYADNPDPNYSILLSTTNGSGFTIQSGWTISITGTLTFGSQELIGGTIGLNSPGINNISVDGSTIEFQTLGTYDLRTSTISGTIELTNTSGSPVTVQLLPGTSFINTGPNITVESSVAVTITAGNLIDGTRVYLYNVTQDALLDNSIVSGGYTFNGTLGVGEELEDGDTVQLKAAYQSGLTAKLPIVTSGVVGTSGLSFIDVQEDDEVYIRIGVDGALQDSSNGGPLTADFTNIEIDVNDADNSFDATHGVAWWRYITQTSSGIAQYDLEALQYNPDEYNVLINGPLLIENSKAANLTIFNGIWTRADATNIIASTSNTVHWVPDGRVYVAETGTSGLTPAESVQLDSIPTTIEMQAIIDAQDAGLTLEEYIALS